MGSSSGVSILVVLDDWFGAGDLRPAVCSTQVSILVVLDDWFGDSKPKEITAVVRVSILVVLDDWFGAYHLPAILPKVKWFQSLLFWMIGSGPILAQRAMPCEWVSILVVLDDWFGAEALDSSFR